MKFPKSATLGFLGLVLSVPVSAATWGTFCVADKSLTIEGDSESGYMAAGATPRLYLLTDVQKIQRGDTVRICYLDGRFFDFEATRQCSYAASPSCDLKNPVLVTAASPGVPGPIRKKMYKVDTGNSCNSQMYETYKVPTGYWTSRLAEYPGGIQGTVAQWIDTGVRTYRERVDGTCK